MKGNIKDYNVKNNISAMPNVFVLHPTVLLHYTHEELFTGAAKLAVSIINSECFGGKRQEYQYPRQPSPIACSS